MPEARAAADAQRAAAEGAATESAAVADFPATLAAAWATLAQRIDRLDARFLLEQVLGCTHAQLRARPELPIDSAQWQTLTALATRRAAGEPLAYLQGFVDFCSLRLAVTPAVLVPRPETEELVAYALTLIAERAQPLVLDLGTGSGAIALAIAAARADARVVAVDVSPAALAVALDNAAAHALAVDCCESDWYAKLPALPPVDLIVANPPYVAAGDSHLQGDGLRFEPLLALTDAADGLSCLRAIIAGAPQWLAAGGQLCCEHGFDQAAACRQLLRAGGFAEVASRRDLSGQERISGGRWLG
jgi:release factor glutamine methyltransferase